MTWNIDGIRGKEFDIDFISMIKQHDIVSLLETWSTDNCDFSVLSDTLCEFDTPIVHHGLKLSRHGRASGGLLIYVKKNAFQNSSSMLVTLTVELFWK